MTFNRRELLRRALHAVQEQTRPVQEVVIANNASIDGTAEMLTAEFPEATVLEMHENIGPAGGYARAFEYGLKRGHDWLWAFNDDDWPVPTALDTMLSAVATYPQQVDALGSWLYYEGGEVRPRGALWRGREVGMPIPPQGAPPYETDFLDFTGTLWSAKLVASVGVPRAEFFMGMWANEYSLRARSQRLRLTIVPEPLITCLAAGSTGSSPPWRGYYQTRNHLAMALSRRRLDEVLWWAVRTTKFLVAALLFQDRKSMRIRLRLLGAWHGTRGITGRTVDPLSYSRL